ncbi:MAG: RagB/SusD family nutrient uptake outer membrane protein, partial [Leeuwenhoekiella sp.]
MKKYNSIFRLLTVAFVAVMLWSCSEDFLERPPEDTYSLDEFYSSNEQVSASTNGLYGKPWFSLHNKALYAIGEVGSGNSFSYSSDINSLRLLNITTTDPVLLDAWKSCFAVVAQSNALINLLPSRVSGDVDQEVVDNTIAEAHFMRGLAYFYLVRLWGPVPIIENNADFVTEPQLNTNRVEDVYTFIENDLNYATEYLYAKVRGSSYSDNGHVSKGSSKALLAKVSLYEKKYDQARQLAQEVINSGEFKLYGGAQLPEKSFGDLFLTENNNNEESVIAWQWTLGGYNTGNYCNTQFAYSSIINNATYGGVFAPSQDLLGAFEPGDLRRKQTVMLPGDYYPNLPSANGPD